MRIALGSPSVPATHPPTHTQTHTSTQATGGTLSVLVCFTVIDPHWLTLNQNLRVDSFKLLNVLSASAECNL